MPYHSSKNFYKAEQEYDDYHNHQDWVNKEYDWYYYYHEDDDHYCVCGREYRCKCGYRYSSTVNYNPEPIDCGAFSTCDFCYDYKAKGMKELIEDYFTPKEILETLQKHLQDTNCWCYERVRTHILRRRVDKMLHPRRCSMDVFIPTEYRNDVLTDCVIKILDKQLGKEVKALHDIKVRNEKIFLLAKYGLTLDDYERIRYDRLNLQENPIVLPQGLAQALPQGLAQALPQGLAQALPEQKFIKVKESTLQEGTFT